MRRVLSLRIPLALIAAATVACGSDTPTTPTPDPTPTQVNETFTGTLTVNGAVTFAPIVVGTAGAANATLTSLLPRYLMRTAEGGSGAFTPGETAFIGPSVEEATGKATVLGWNPTTRTLFLDNDLVGVLALESEVVGSVSGARWTNVEVKTSFVGLALGTWNDAGTCTIVLANDIAGVSGRVSGVVQGPGNLCARVYDVGQLETTATFTIDVSHF